MTHSTQAIQAVTAQVHTYRYSAYANAQTSLASAPRLTITNNNVISCNERLIVLDDEQFTSITIDGTDFAGKHQLNKPTLHLYLDDEYFGTGIIFTLNSSISLTLPELKEIIASEYRKKTSMLSSIDLSDIDSLFPSDIDSEVA